MAPPFIMAKSAMADRRTSCAVNLWNLPKLHTLLSPGVNSFPSATRNFLSVFTPIVIQSEAEDFDNTTFFMLPRFFDSL